MMKSHEAYREKWLQRMAREYPSVSLQTAEYHALREAVLKGMQAYMNEEPVNSSQLKLIRAVWSKLAPVHTNAHFTIEVSTIGGE
jgi:predicted transcriptional regulator